MKYLLAFFAGLMLFAAPGVFLIAVFIWLVWLGLKSLFGGRR